MQCTASIASSGASASVSRASSRAFGRRVALPYHSSSVASLRCRAAKVDDAQEQAATIPSALLPSALLFASPLLLDVHSALAANGELGLLEGRTAALVHPAAMFALFAGSVYAAYLGIQWRRTRELGEEIRNLRKSAPTPAVAAEGAAPVESPASAQIQGLEKERKELLAGNFKDKHAWWGSILLAAGTGIAIEGAANTFIRTGKLFPGPHLYFGAAMVAIWALAAAMTTEMQKGNEAARYAHIGLNTINLLMFASQIPSGLEIVGKVFQFTQWP